MDQEIWAAGVLAESTAVTRTLGPPGTVWKEHGPEPASNLAASQPLDLYGEAQIGDSKRNSRRTCAPGPRSAF